MNEFERALEKSAIPFKKDVPLKLYSTWKIGGPADFLVEVENSEMLENVLMLSQSTNTPITILGGASNVLISDKGVRGLVIINSSRNIYTIDRDDVEKSINEAETQDFDIWVTPRHGEEEDERLYTFSDLDYEESGSRVLVRADSGVPMPFAIAWTLKNEITGLQWFGGIPGTIGGALYNNIHGGTKHFSDYFQSAEVFENGIKKTVGRDYFNFGYDQSVLRDKPDVFVLNVVLKLFRGDAQKAKFVAKEWTQRKRIQPKVSAGCVFKNLSPEIQHNLGFPSPSIGYILDKKLGLIGTQYGGAQISLKHAAFIENIDNATSFDVLHLMRLIKNSIHESFGVELEPEISLLGFNPEEVKDIVGLNKN